MIIVQYIIAELRYKLLVLSNNYFVFTSQSMFSKYIEHETQHVKQLFYKIHRIIPQSWISVIRGFYLSVYKHYALLLLLNIGAVSTPSNSWI